MSQIPALDFLMANIVKLLEEEHPDVRGKTLRESVSTTPDGEGPRISFELVHTMAVEVKSDASKRTSTLPATTASYPIEPPWRYGFPATNQWVRLVVNLRT